MNDQTQTTGWRCFHCDELFTDPDDARLHFGEDCVSDAACQISAAAVREMEKQIARYRIEDSDTDRAMWRMQAEHLVALRRAEEEGYRNGFLSIRCIQMDENEWDERHPPKTVRGRPEPQKPERKWRWLRMWLRTRGLRMIGHLNTEICNEWRKRRNEERRKANEARVFAGAVAVLCVIGWLAACLVIDKMTRVIAGIWIPL